MDMDLDMDLDLARGGGDDVDADASFASDYGVPVSRQEGAYDLGYGYDNEDAYGGMHKDEGGDEDGRLAADGDDGDSDSGSSIDLHTPLPCVPLSPAAAPGLIERLTD